MHATRGSLLQALILAPAIVVGLALCAIEGVRVMRPADLAAPSSLAQAILHGSVEDAFGFIKRGQDPNAPIVVEDPDFAAGRRMEVLPLLLAVEARQENIVSMLLSAEVRLDLPGNILAVCLARKKGYDELEELLKAVATPPAACPAQVIAP